MGAGARGGRRRGVRPGRAAAGQRRRACHATGQAPEVLCHLGTLDLKTRIRHRLTCCAKYPCFGLAEDLELATRWALAALCHAEPPPAMTTLDVDLHDPAHQLLPLHITAPRDAARTGRGARQGRLGEGQQEGLAGGRQRGRPATLHGARHPNPAPHLCLVHCGTCTLAWLRCSKEQIRCKKTLQGYAQHAEVGDAYLDA